MIPAANPSPEARRGRSGSALDRAAVVAITGTPNCGKTTLFNALTGLRQKVANYPGVTVERKEGLLKGSALGPLLLDLPGIYSMSAQTPDEAVARDVVRGKGGLAEPPSALLLVLDGSALERSLALASTLLPLGLPTAAVVTMFDEIKARGGSLDVQALSRELGVPVQAVVGHRGVGLEELGRMIAGWELWPRPSGPGGLNGAPSRYAWAHAALSRCLRSPLKDDGLTSRIDKVVLHPVTGPLVFLAVMAFFFQSIFSWAQPAMDALTELCAALGRLAAGALPEGPLRGFVASGIFDGVGSVVAFLPQIMILFFLLYLLEDIGYMARAAFLMDRIMGWAGLQGRSFIALVSSNACAVPGIMATRAIPSPKDRLATMLAAPFMTCSARLPVYALLIAAFVPDRAVLGPLRSQGLTLLVLYALGAVSALLAARILRSTLLKGDITPFYMELPPYRFPSLRSVVIAMLGRARIFLRRAGTVILAMSLVVWLFLSLPRATPPPGASEAEAASLQLRHSLAGRLGRALEPVFSPLGFDWRVNVAILASLPAREVLVATLAQIYAVESPDGEALPQTLREGKDPSTGKPFMTMAVALSLLAFFVYALQCLSTLAVMRRETGGWRWPAFAFLYMFACAYAASFLAYRSALALGLG